MQAIAAPGHFNVIGAGAGAIDPVKGNLGIGQVEDLSGGLVIRCGAGAVLELQRQVEVLIVTDEGTGIDQGDPDHQVTGII